MDLKIPRLKEEQKILATLNPEQVKRVLEFKPRGVNQIRTHAAATLILDGGYRISEVLELVFDNCDFDNLVMKVRGKGNKHRLVPVSNEMRKRLYRYAAKNSGPGRLLFGTRNNTLVTVRNFERDFKAIGQKLQITGVRFSPHTLRHTFAVQYLRAGGNLFYLSKILGHTSITTTQKYLQSVGVDDLLAVHDRLSPLSPGKWRGAALVRDAS
jgi:site-specific recombinase XerD